ncbi:hypothetical protein EV652_11314 [Kribbella steppae]|uniref:Uncharacterized protein n=1 Tax=Kribbella steppae TaxID=2512223 RepID=A0A4R2H4D3_9ACTN|nr:hypothetical protein [Kribbella steppae]TCO19615.1 hypothetical protein EV652_11314 [Kribbella steppae]
MTRRMALSRIIFGILLLALLFGGPHLYGRATAADKLADCLVGTTSPQNVVVKLSYVPGPTQLEDLQRYGRYGGSRGDLQSVVLLDVPAQNVTLLSQLYWVDRVDTEDGC